MKLATCLISVVLLALLVLHGYVLNILSRQSSVLKANADIRYNIIPSQLVKITSLEFDGLVADMVYLKTIVFFGSTLSGTNRRKATEAEFRWIDGMLTLTTDVDPYFLDPYLFANSALTWEAGKVREANLLLEKGVRFRTWDYWLPFYLGFNYFYFLGDNDRASKYLIEASGKPGASPFYGHLGARLAYNSNNVDNAVIFMENIVKNIQDKTMKRDYELRLQALKSIQYLQYAVSEFKAATGRLPHDFFELLSLGYIKQIPLDPYGGTFYLDSKGFVKTTSELRMVEN